MPNAFMQALTPYADLLAIGRGYHSQRQQLAALCVQVQQIESPTGDELRRAVWVADQFAALGLADVEQDSLYNVFGCVRGQRSDRPALLVSAHTDTVFPAGTDLSITVDADTGHIRGPGIGDNSTGVASLLTLAEALAALQPPVDVWLVANSSEEGNGDLRGMRGAVDRLESQIGASIVIEGTGLGRIVHRALGSRRYRITMNAPGGHSWSDYGSASAIHALVQLADDIARLKPPTDPRTTFNIGRIYGGTSINTIAQQASLELDLRSESPAALGQIDEQVRQIIQKYMRAPWRRQHVYVEKEVIGDRPGGEISPDHPLVVAAQQALVAAGLTARPELQISSTDANIPLSRGIPSVCVGITQGGNAHRLEEWINPRYLPSGVQHLLLLTWWTTLWLAGEIR